jgi:hypothetical protein
VNWCKPDLTINRLAAAPADDGLVIRDIWLLRLPALLAHARGNGTAYAQLRDRCQINAESSESVDRGERGLSRRPGGFAPHLLFDVGRAAMHHFEVVSVAAIRRTII